MLFFKDYPPPPAVTFSNLTLPLRSSPCGFSFVLGDAGGWQLGRRGWPACRWQAANAGVGTAPESQVQCGPHPVALPSAAPEVENAVTLQESQDGPEGEGEKKTMMKKMMVWEPHPRLWHWGGEGAEVPSPPAEEVEAEVVRGQTKRQELGLESQLHL